MTLEAGHAPVTPMTGADLYQAMIELGRKWGWDRAPNARELGRALKNPAKDPGEIIRNALHRRDEPVPWLLATSIEMMLNGMLPPGGIPERLYDKTTRKPRGRTRAELIN